MIADTKALLASRGLALSAQALDELMEEAIRRLQRTLYPADPKRDLPEEEVKLLEKGGFRVSPARQGKRDPLARTVAEFAALLKSSLSTAEAAKRLGVDPSRVRQRLTADRPTLYGVRVGAEWVLPELQFDRDRLVPGFGEVVSRLDPELHPVAVQRWFTTPNPDLTAESLGPRTLSPRDWLLAGQPVANVVRLAEDL
jgi:hypothetical protein